MPRRQREDLEESGEDCDEFMDNRHAQFNTSIKRCNYCDTLLLASGTSTLCCGNGRHKLKPQDVYLPPEFMEFYRTNAQLLMKSGREINQLCSLSCFGVEQEVGGRTSYSGGVQQAGPEVCSVNGRVFHFNWHGLDSSASHPLLGSGASYLFSEPGADSVPINQRYNCEVVMAALQLRQLLRAHNTLVRDVMTQYGTDASFNILQCQELFLLYSEEPTAQRGLSLIYSLNGCIFDRPRVEAVLNWQTSIYRTWNCDEPEYERSCFILLDPAGSSGYLKTQRDRFRDEAGHELFLKQYCKYKSLQSKILPLCGDLKVEWLLDMVSRMDTDRGMYMARQHSNTMQATVAELKSNRDRIGRLWKVPADVRGSWKQRQQLVRKGLALVAHFGVPHLFITFTANPRWEEIQSLLSANEEWFQNPHVVNRAFYQRLKVLEHGLLTGRFFGGKRAISIQRVIEFQKRGLPHAHLLITFDDPRAYMTHDQVDEDVSCKLPVCPNSCGSCEACRVREQVLRHMVHKCSKGRCHAGARGADQKRKYDAGLSHTECKYQFPQKPCAETTLSTDGFWELKREPHESNIVSYNKELLVLFDAHINVEISAGVRGIMYLRKYMSKCVDCSDVALSSQRDLDAKSAVEQTKIFFKCRHLAGSEASWVALGFSFNLYFPAVKLLYVHLPQQNMVPFNPADLQEAQDTCDMKYTDLLRYFKRPFCEPFSSMRYEEYFSRCLIQRAPSQGSTYDNCNPPHSITIRHLPIVARVQGMNVNNSEMFALLLILRSASFRSFEEVLDGETTFWAAARKRSLIGEEASLEMYDQQLQFMSNDFVAPSIVRYFLACLILNEVPETKQLFDKYFAAMYDQRVVDELHSKKIIIRQLSDILLKEGFDLKDAWTDDFTKNCLSQSSTFFDLQASVVARSIEGKNSTALREEQQAVYDAMLESFRAGEKLLFLNGSAGCGKTLLLLHLFASLSEMGLRCLCSAFTGKAASILPGGVTCHRLFGLPVSEDSQDLDPSVPVCSSISRSSNQARWLASCDVIFIDEVSFLSCVFFDCIDELLRMLMDSQSPFGGKTVIVGGDMKQLAPVCASRSSASAIQQSPVFSCLWPLFKSFRLSKSQRFVNPSYAQFLEEVGLGRSSIVTLPSNIKVTTSRDDAIALSHELGYFPDMNVIAGHHEDVHFYNQYFFDHMSIDGETHTFSAHYSNSSSFLDLQQAENFNPPRTPPHALTLFIGCKVMLLRNMLPSSGLCNGTLLTVSRFCGGGVFAVVDEGSFAGKSVFIPRYRTNITFGNTKATRHQLPLIVAYSYTINKSQGQTFCAPAIIDLQAGVFQHGQTYVALSRPVDEERIIVVAQSGREITNIVHHEILRKAHLL